MRSTIETSSTLPRNLTTFKWAIGKSPRRSTFDTPSTRTKLPPLDCFAVAPGVTILGALRYKLGFVILNACYTDFKKGDEGDIPVHWLTPWLTEHFGPLGAGGQDWASESGDCIFKGHKGVLVPLVPNWIPGTGFLQQYHTVKKVFTPGKQRTIAGITLN